jgi:hypothetical protein
VSYKPNKYNDVLVRGEGTLHNEVFHHNLGRFHVFGRDVQPRQGVVEQRNDALEVNDGQFLVTGSDELCEA